MNNNILRLSLFFLLYIFFIIQASSAEVQSPSPVKMAEFDSLENVLNQPDDGQRVILKGTIIGKLGHDRYLFSNGHRSIYIYIDNEDLPEEPITEEGCIVKITGEVSVGFFSPPEIKVAQVSIIKQGGIHNIKRKLSPVSKILLNKETDQKVEVMGQVTLFADDDEFVLKDGDSYIYVDVDGGAKKDLAEIQEGDFVYVSGTTKSRRFYFRNNTSRTFIKARRVIKQTPETEAVTTTPTKN